LFPCFPTSCDLLSLLTAIAQETRLCDSAWAWRCKGRGCGIYGVAAGRGPVDVLIRCRCWRALWTVADEDLLRCLYCGESPVDAGCDGWVVASGDLCC
jgi:hypothetical protein